MDRLHVVPTCANDVGIASTISNGSVVGRRNNIDKQSSSYEVNTTSSNSNSNSNSTSINDGVIPLSISSSFNNNINNNSYIQNQQIKRNKHSIMKNTNSTHSINSVNSYTNSGTRITPMEFEEELQPLRIRQLNSNSTEHGRKGNKRRPNRNNSKKNNLFYSFHDNTNKNSNGQQQEQYHYEHYDDDENERQRDTTYQSKLLFIDRLLIIIRLHFEYYPRICCIIFIILTCSVSYCIWISDYIQKPITRNRLSEDYTTMDLHYNWKKSKIHHWCLWGGDDDCTCDDFTEPIQGGESKPDEWMNVHTANVNKINTSKEYDVVFYGDEMIQSWTGRWLNMPMYPLSDSNNIISLWNRTFQKDTGGSIDGISLGIKGDTCPNLLWRLQNGEMPVKLKAKVFWLLIGTNDLAVGGCSEEAVLLGILRLADEIHFHNKDSRIVIQGILPRTKSKDGTLMTLDKLTESVSSLSKESKKNSKNKKIKKKKKLQHVSAFIHDRITNRYDPGRAHNPDEAKKKFHLWPSIQHINNELEKFCNHHEHLIYFNSNDLFLGSLSNEHYTTSNMKIISDLMPDMIHPSYDGYRIMAKAITKELNNILSDNNEENYIETQQQHDTDSDNADVANSDNDDTDTDTDDNNSNND